MKVLKIIVILVGIGFFGLETTYAQAKKIVPIQLNETSSKSMTVSQLPDKVKEAASKYAGYKIKKAFVSQYKRNKKLYKVQIARGPIVYDLIIDSKGKVLSTGE